MRHPGFRYLAFTGPDSAEHFRAGAQRCGDCDHLGDKKPERAGGYCTSRRMMVRTDLAIDCNRHTGGAARRGTETAWNLCLLPGVRCTLIQRHSGPALILAHPDGPPLMVDLATGDVRTIGAK